ncbi:hypothetical protein K8I31_10610, partial [bacterium]|nr:hypothetical protein [bacterium]
HESIIQERAQLIQRLLGGEEVAGETKPADEMSEDELNFWFSASGAEHLRDCMDGVEEDVESSL